MQKTSDGVRLRAKTNAPIYLAVMLCLLALGFAPVSEARLWGPWLWPDLDAGLPVGTAVSWTAFALGAPRQVEYRYSVSRDGDLPRIVRDFHPRKGLRYRFMEDGLYEMIVTARNTATGEIATASRILHVEARTTEGDPVITLTEHPLVALYSLPPCEATAEAVRVHFKPIFGGTWQTTHWKPCGGDGSVTFLVAGMRAATSYYLRHEFKGPVWPRISRRYRFRTGRPAVELPTFTLLDPPDAGSSSEDILLHSSLLSASATQPVQGWAYPLATDLFGRLVWYYPPAYIAADLGGYITRPVAGGTMLLFTNDLGNGETDQFVREVDLAGNVVGETTGGRINEQLAAMGLATQTAMHHEAVRLPNGHTLVLAAVESIIENVQGSDSVHLLGDMIIDLDENWQVAWTWNSFNHLDLDRPPVLGETTRGIIDGTPPIYLSDEAVDWTHMNTITYVPADGNLLLSSRHQAMVYKIDYEDGDGTGAVLWRLGEGGDFTLQSTGEADPWFSHQHQVLLYDDNELVIMDNGNARCDGFLAGCNSRGQVYHIDELNLVAELSLSVDLGDYALAFGSAQRLSNGNYHFLLGILLSEEVTARSVEVTPGGTVTYDLKSLGLLYRSFRVNSLYEGL